MSVLIVCVRVGYTGLINPFMITSVGMVAVCIRRQLLMVSCYCRGAVYRGRQLRTVVVVIDPALAYLTRGSVIYRAEMVDQAHSTYQVYT